LLENNIASARAERLPTSTGAGAITAEGAAAAVGAGAMTGAAGGAAAASPKADATIMAIWSAKEAAC